MKYACASPPVVWIGSREYHSGCPLKTVHPLKLLRRHAVQFASDVRFGRRVAVDSREAPVAGHSEAAADGRRLTDELRTGEKSVVVEASLEGSVDED